MTDLPRERIRSLIKESGFDLVRFTDASPLHQERARYLSWIEQGRQGEMRWITPDWARRASDPGDAVPQARSVICVGVCYRSAERAPADSSHGLIARYAWGKDYHQVMGDLLETAAHRLRADFGGAQRWFVDAGPAMDKALAARSGLGWYGKNTNILTDEFGSYVLLGEIITTLEIKPDDPIRRDCGGCRLCVIACPTGALGPDYSIDSRRCISYLTIEHRGPIPRELRPQMGAWVFGCDICQDVCPPSNAPFLESTEEKSAWRASLRDTVRDGVVTASGFAGTTQRSDPLFSGQKRQSVDLTALLRLTHADYLAMFRGSSIRRAKVWMLRRNAAVALGNVGGREALTPLEAALRSDDNAIVRGHAAWALGRIGERTGAAVAPMLSSAALAEEDETVKEEIQLALGLSRPTTPQA